MTLDFISIISEKSFSTITYVLYSILGIEDITFLIFLSFLIFSYVIVLFCSIFLNYYVPSVVFFMAFAFGVFSQRLDFIYDSRELNGGVFIDELMLMSELSSVTAFNTIFVVLMIFVLFSVISNGKQTFKR